MSPEPQIIEQLTILNHIADTLNRAVDVRSVLDHTLADLVKLMGLETAWISLREPSEQGGDLGNRWTLAAHHNLPPALSLDNTDAWAGICTCQQLCDERSLTEAYNEVRCSRLGRAHGDRRGLTVHATTPLRSGDRSLGVLNVAAPDWSAFSSYALSLLTNVGSQMGTALERARLYDLVRDRRLHQQAALLEFSDRLLRQRDLDDLFAYLVEQVRQMLSVDACALLLPGDGPGMLEFRASSGWHKDPRFAKRQVPADARSGPGLVMQTHEPFVLEDLLASDRTSWAPTWLRTEGFRGHAVVPLMADEQSIGVLVINHRQPKLLPDEDLRGLQLMANQAAIAIEKARLQEEEVRMQAMEKELEIGREIQLSLLPEEPPVVSGWEFAAYYQAAREVGGDFYGFFALPGGSHRLGITIADVTGKGVPAALFMARTNAMIRSAALGGLRPSSVLRQVNDLILDDSRAELLVTAFYAVLEPKTGELLYANAGHSRPLWLPNGATEAQELPSRGLLLGAFAGIEPEQYRTDLARGDLLVLYTDGVTEAMNASLDLFGEERLAAVVAANSGASAQQVLEAIVDAVRAFAGEVAQSDDLTLLIARRCHST